MPSLSSVSPTFSGPVPTLHRLHPRQMLRNFSAKTAEEQLLLLSGLVFVPSAVLQPVVTKIQLQRSRVPEPEIRLLVKKSIADQVVGAGLWFANFYGGIALFGQVFKKAHAKTKTFLQFGGAVLAATLSHGLLRPILSNALLLRWVHDSEGRTQSPDHPDDVRKNAYSPPWLQSSPLRLSVEPEKRQPAEGLLVRDLVPSVRPGFDRIRNPVTPPFGGWW